MIKASTSRKLSIYFIATALCLVIVSASIDGGLIKTTYGYGYGDNKTNDTVKDNNDKKAVVSDTKTIASSVSTADSHKKEKEKEEKRLKNSQKSVEKGAILLQSGKGFKKNSKIRLYFSKPDGTFYPPIIVKTDNKGKFSIKYLAAKPAGKYKWYAVIPSSGKKTKISSYTIVK